jgi:hypothetical protein
VGIDRELEALLCRSLGRGVAADSLILALMRAVGRLTQEMDFPTDILYDCLDEMQRPALIPDADVFYVLISPPADA